MPVMLMTTQDVGVRLTASDTPGIIIFCQEETKQAWSISSLAAATKACGMLMPSIFAVFRLIASSNFVGRSTGRSDGFAPLLSAKIAVRRFRSRIFAP